MLKQGQWDQVLPIRKGGIHLRLFSLNLDGLGLLNTASVVDCGKDGVLQHIKEDGWDRVVVLVLVLDSEQTIPETKQKILEYTVDFDSLNNEIMFKVDLLELKYQTRAVEN